MSVFVTIHLRMRENNWIYSIYVNSHINGKQEFIMCVNICQKVANYPRMTI